MNKDETIKKLGFTSEEEMLLYQDVCGNNVVFSTPDSLEELLNDLENDDMYAGHRKDDFEKFIRDNNLLDLFNKVKTMPLLNRFIEIYVYNANGLSICKSMLEIINNKLQEAKELFDGEKEQELEMQLFSIKRSKSNYSKAIDYVDNQVNHRLSPNDMSKFYESTDVVTKTAYRINNEEPHKKM